MKNAAALLLLTIATACRAGGEDIADVAGIRFSPTSDDARTHLEEAIGRWEAAGLARGTLVIAEGGAPVSIKSEVYSYVQNAAGETVWGPVGGVTALVDGRVKRIEMRADASLSAWAHELGHAMGLEHGEGLMSRRDLAGGHPIDAHSLAELCEIQACDFFQPEQE